MAFLNKNIQAFMTHCIRKGLSTHSLRAYERDLNHLQTWLRNDLDLAEFTKEIIEGWVTHMQDTGGYSIAFLVETWRARFWPFPTRDRATR